MSILVENAISLAFRLHASQKRKSSIVPGAPYMSHLLEVTGMVMANGGDDTTCAAAVLHDALEDVGGDAREQILNVCGQKVLNLVQECTEIDKSKSWKVRKDAYLAHLSYVSQGALLISVADKLQSLRELCRQVLMQQNDEAYAAFAKKEYATVAERKEAVLWFHKQLIEAFSSRLHDLKADADPRLIGIEVLIAEFHDFVARMFRNA